MLCFVKILFLLVPYFLLDLSNLVNNLSLHLVHQFLDFLEVSLRVDLLCHRLEVQKLWLCLQAQNNFRLDLFHDLDDVFRLLIESQFELVELVVRFERCLLENAEEFLDLVLVERCLL